jgi:hypothetical protein
MQIPENKVASATAHLSAGFDVLGHLEGLDMMELVEGTACQDHLAWHSETHLLAPRYSVPSMPCELGYKTCSAFTRV